MSNPSLNITSAIRALFYALFFFTPLILWPFTSEVFEFNKMMFVYLLTTLITSLWAVESVINHKLEIKRTPLDLPLLLFLISQIISTLVSINPHTSLWGYYSRFHGGLMSTISYLLLYYAAVTHFAGDKKGVDKIIKAVLLSATIVSIYAVLEHFGIDKDIWVQDVQNRVFSTLGQPNWLSAFLVAILPLSLYRLFSEKKLSQRLVYLALSLLFLTSIIFTKSQSGIASAGVVLLLFSIVFPIKKKKAWLALFLLPIVATIILLKSDALGKTLSSLNKINPFYSDTLSIISEENKTRVGGSDSMTIRRVVWEGALKLGLQYPLFGTGVETFGYSYYWVRSAAHNLTSEAEFIYNKAHNEYLNFFATTGFAGLLAYLFLIAAIIRVFVYRQSSSSQLRFPLFLGFISVLITNYFGFSVVNVAIFFFLFPALVISEVDLTHSNQYKTHFNSNTAVFIIILICIWLLSGLRRAWLGDIAYNQGRTSLEEAERAVKLNPTEPIYYAQLGNVNSLVVTQVIAPQIAKLPATASAEIKKQAQAYLNKYLEASISNLDKAQRLSPYNINILKMKAKTELNLSQVDSRFQKEALKTLLEIVRLSPSDNNNYLNLGLLYQSLGQEDQAGFAFKKALELRPDSQQAKELLNTIETKK